MAETDPFLNEVTQKIQSFIDGFKHCGLVNMVHDITFGNGEITMLMNNLSMPAFFVENKIPAFSTDNSGRCLKPGIYINQTMDAKKQEYDYLMKNFFKVAQKQQIFYGSQTLHFFKVEEGAQHLYTLFFDLSGVSGHSSPHL